MWEEMWEKRGSAWPESVAEGHAFGVRFPPSGQRSLRRSWNRLTNGLECTGHVATIRQRLSASLGPSCVNRSGTILLTRKECRIVEDRRDCHWLYVLTHCGTEPQIQEPPKDPARFPWNEVQKVAHYYLTVNALTQPMQVREDSPPYGGGS